MFTSSHIWQVAHAELNSTQYVKQMRNCKAWLSTTGPADLVGTRFFEVQLYGSLGSLGGICWWDLLVGSAECGLWCGI